MPETQMVSDLHAAYAAMRSEHPNADPWLVLEGDWGGQIYVTVPWRLVVADARVDLLLSELDRIAWSCNDGAGCFSHLYDPRLCGDLPVDGVSGGMGGGALEDGLWLHGEFGNACRARATELLHL